jgi:hypothetical protein
MNKNKLIYNDNLIKENIMKNKYLLYIDYILVQLI